MWHCEYSPAPHLLHSTLPFPNDYPHVLLPGNSRSTPRPTLFHPTLAGSLARSRSSPRPRSLATHLVTSTIPCPASDLTHSSPTDRTLFYVRPALLSHPPTTTKSAPKITSSARPTSYAPFATPSGRGRRRARPSPSPTTITRAASRRMHHLLRTSTPTASPASATAPRASRRRASVRRARTRSTRGACGWSRGRRISRSTSQYSANLR